MGARDGWRHERPLHRGWVLAGPPFPAPGPPHLGLHQPPTLAPGLKQWDQLHGVRSLFRLRAWGVGSRESHISQERSRQGVSTLWSPRQRCRADEQCQEPGLQPRPYQEGQPAGQAWAAGLGCAGNTSQQPVTSPSRHRSDPPCHIQQRGDGSSFAPSAGLGTRLMANKTQKVPALGSNIQGEDRLSSPRHQRELWTTRNATK